MPVHLLHNPRSPEERSDAARHHRWIEVDLPTRYVHPIAPPPMLATALMAEPRYAGRCGDNLVVLLDDAATVERLQPDYRLLRLLPIRSVIVTAPSTEPPNDFVARVFLPGIGKEQDPATALALCCLRPFWRARLGRDRLSGIQLSRRGDGLEIRFDGDRTLLGTRNVTVRPMGTGAPGTRRVTPA